MADRIAGYVEQIFTRHVTGWAAVLDDSGDLSVRLTREGCVLARTLPAFARPDVEGPHKLGRKTGFYLAHENMRDLLQNGACIEAGSQALGFVTLPAVEGAFEAKAQRYQDFGSGDVGNSKSEAKLAALQLGFLDHLKSRAVRVLDLGCNEGFFCDAVARHLDAGFVLGIDSDAEYIARARTRFPQFTFRQQSWWQVEEGDFDVILFLSAIHYERDQAGLLQFLSRKLRPGGVLVLECGIGEALMVHQSERWVVAHRPDGLFRYPTYDHLVHGLLAPFSVKYIEKSVAQSGDPVGRHVLHCWSRQQDVILLGGASGRGKTALARALGRSPGVQTIHTDLLILRLLTDPYLENAGLALRMRRFFTWPADIGLVQQYLHDNGLIKDFVDLLMLTIDQDCTTIVIEGAFLDDPAMSEALERRLEDGRRWRLQ